MGKSKKESYIEIIRGRAQLMGVAGTSLTDFLGQAEHESDLNPFKKESFAYGPQRFREIFATGTRRLEKKHGLDKLGKTSIKRKIRNELRAERARRKDTTNELNRKEYIKRYNARLYKTLSKEDKRKWDKRWNQMDDDIKSMSSKGFTKSKYPDMSIEEFNEARREREKRFFTTTYGDREDLGTLGKAGAGAIGLLQMTGIDNRDKYMPELKENPELIKDENYMIDAALKYWKSKREAKAAELEEANKPIDFSNPDVSSKLVNPKEKNEKALKSRSDKTLEHKKDFIDRAKLPSIEGSKLLDSNPINGNNLSRMEPELEESIMQRIRKKVGVA